MTATGDAGRSPDQGGALDLTRLLDPVEAARYLLGAELRRILPGGAVLSGRIVETEAYHEDDPASHTFRGPTARNAAMFGPPGHAYIYFTYGMHWCFNVTAGPAGRGAGVLVRAVEPLEGVTEMERRRGLAGRNLTNGPAKLAQAFGIDRELYGHDLSRPPLMVTGGGGVGDTEVTVSTRVGLSVATDETLRFYVTGSPAVSRR